MEKQQYDEIEYFKDGKSIYKTCLQRVSNSTLRKAIWTDRNRFIVKDIDFPDRVVILTNGAIRIDSDWENGKQLIDELKDDYPVPAPKKHSKEFYGANLRTLIDTEISKALHNGINLKVYNYRQCVIDEIEKRLQSDEFTAICTDNGTTFEKTFDPKKNKIKTLSLTFDHEDLICLVNGSSPDYSIMPLMNNLGSFNDNTGWRWHYEDLKMLDLEELYQVYLTCKTSNK